MKPDYVSQALLNIASYIENARMPSRSMIAAHIESILVSLNPHLSAENSPWGKEGPAFDPVTKEPIKRLVPPYVNITPRSLLDFVPTPKDYYIGPGGLGGTINVDPSVILDLAQNGAIIQDVSLTCTKCHKKADYPGTGYFKFVDMRGFGEIFICVECEESAKHSHKRDWRPDQSRIVEQEYSLPYDPIDTPVRINRKLSLPNNRIDKYLEFCLKRNAGFKDDEVKLMGFLTRSRPSAIEKILNESGLFPEESRASVESIISDWVSQKLENYLTTYTMPDLNGLLSKVHSVDNTVTKNALKDKLAEQGLSLATESGLDGKIEGVASEFKDMHGQPKNAEFIKTWVKRKSMEKSDPRQWLEMWESEVIGDVLDELSKSFKVSRAGLANLLEHLKSKPGYLYGLKNSGYLAMVMDVLTDPNLDDSTKKAVEDSKIRLKTL